MFCIHCGADNQHEGNFCFQCGKALVSSDAITAESNPQASTLESQQGVIDESAIPTEKTEVASGSQNFFITVWQGDWGLAKTYWIVGVVLGNLLGFALAPILKAGVSIWVLIGVFVFFQIWACVGVWESAGKYKGPIVWRYLSRGAMLIGAMFLIAGLVVLERGLNQGKASQSATSAKVENINGEPARAAQATKSGVDTLQADDVIRRRRLTILQSDLKSTLDKTQYSVSLSFATDTEIPQLEFEELTRHFSKGFRIASEINSLLSIEKNCFICDKIVSNDQKGVDYIIWFGKRYGKERYMAIQSYLEAVSNADTEKISYFHQAYLNDKNKVKNRTKIKKNE